MRIVKPPKLSNNRRKGRLVTDLSSDEDENGNSSDEGDSEEESDEDSEEEEWPVGPIGSVGIGGWRRKGKGYVSRGTTGWTRRCGWRSCMLTTDLSLLALAVPRTDAQRTKVEQRTTDSTARPTRSKCGMNSQRLQVGCVKLPFISNWTLLG